MICIECNAEVSGEERYCGNCGAKFALVPDFLQKKKEEFKEKQEKKRLEKEENKRFREERVRLEKERLEKVEREYIETVEKKKQEKEKIQKEQEELERLEKEKQEKIEIRTVKELIKKLDKDDYTILEALRRDNPRLLLRVGVLDSLNKYLKLFRCGLIKKLDRELTFNEKEKLERFKDTPECKQYAALVQRLDCTELRDKFREYKNRLGLKKDDDPVDITEKGKEVLSNMRKKVKEVWQDLKSAYDKKDKNLFREQVDQNMSMFPLFMIMGFANGAMMGTMLGNMGMNSQMYMQDMDMTYDQGYTDGAGDYGGDFGAEGGEFGDAGGGFMDGGMNVGI